MTHLLQITPSITSAADGVTSTATAIGASVASRLGWRSTTTAPDPQRIHSLRRPLGADEGTSHRSPDLVLLHYVNYGYDSLGCPDWLVEGIERWRKETPSAVFCTYFHEVFATASPWRKTFWVSRRQRRLAARLAAASDYCLTSLPLYADLLRGLGSTRPIDVQPVVSSIGEVECPAPFVDRERSMVVFGSAGVRARAYGKYRHELVRACELLGIESIVDVGPEIAVAADMGRPIRVLGRLPSNRVSAILSTGRAGFLGYPLDFLEKSSVFAAYCAHGLLPVCAGDSRRSTGAPVRGEHFLDVARHSRQQEPAEIAAAAAAWYQTHSLARLCDQLVGYLTRQ